MNYYRIYAKSPDETTFKAFNHHTGEMGGNLINIPFFDEDVLEELKEVVETLKDINPGWMIHVRKV